MRFMFGFGKKKKTNKKEWIYREKESGLCVQVLPEWDYASPCSEIIAGLRFYKIRYIQIDYTD